MNHEAFVVECELRIAASQSVKSVCQSISQPASLSFSQLASQSVSQRTIVQSICYNDLQLPHSYSSQKLYRNLQAVSFILH